MQRVLAPRFSSSLTRSFLIQQFQQTQMQQYYPVVDYIPPYQEYQYVTLNNGFELFNVMELQQLQHQPSQN